MKTLAAIFAFLALTQGEQVRFDNFTVYRVTPNSDDAVKALQQLEENPNGFEFWTGPTYSRRPVDIMVPPHLTPRFQDLISSGLFASEVYIKNVQELIDNETPKVKSTRFSWTAYQTLDQVCDLKFCVALVL